MELLGRQVHPIAEMFPLMEGKEFEELVEDIRTNGLRTPILLDRQGRILDGRNRLRACAAAGVEPRFEIFSGSEDEAMALVVSLNLRRRHLNESQRAMLAAQLKETAANWPRKAAEKTALLLNVSPRSVRRATQVLRSGDRSIILLVHSGKLPVSAAAAQVAGHKPKARPPRLKIPAAGEAVLAMWAPAGRIEETVKLVEQWGFEQQLGEGQQTSEADRTLLIATRRNPLAPA